MGWSRTGCARKLSNDPRFTEKLEDIVGLYMVPPEHALVLCCDEKSQVQALDRTQPGLPMKKAIDGYVNAYNKSPKPFVWTAQSSDILQKVIRARRSKQREALHWPTLLGDLQAWVQDFGYDGAPFAFDPERRATRRTWAWYARAYGPSRDKPRDFGEYRIRRWGQLEKGNLHASQDRKTEYVL